MKKCVNKSFGLRSQWNSYHHYRQELIRARHGGDTISFAYRFVQKCWIKQKLSTDFRVCFFDQAMMQDPEAGKTYGRSFAAFLGICRNRTTWQKLKVWQYLW